MHFSLSLADTGEVISSTYSGTYAWRDGAMTQLSTFGGKAATKIGNRLYIARAGEMFVVAL